MPDIILPGPAGRIEARYQRQKSPGAPMALVLHPHPQFGGTMNNPLVYDLYHMFLKLGCTSVRFNFRGVGRSQGTFDSGAGELSDAAAILDWMNTLYPNPSFVWVAGISFGAWIGMQLLMRRPEITGFISIAPPASMYDFAFLAPCPASGLMVHGTKDQVVPEADVQKLVDRLSAQKGIKITYQKIEGANHFFDHHEPEVLEAVEAYVAKTMGVEAAPKV
jgi:alpha/beta superfamily hydrolase